MPATVQRGLQRMREDQWEEWAFDHLHRVMSPGGAAALAGTGRTAMYQWIARGLVHGWEFRRGEVYLDVESVINTAVRLGYRTEQEVRRWRRKLQIG